MFAKYFEILEPFLSENKTPNKETPGGAGILKLIGNWYLKWGMPFAPKAEASTQIQAMLKQDEIERSMVDIISFVLVCK